MTAQASVTRDIEATFEANMQLAEPSKLRMRALGNPAMLDKVVVLLDATACESVSRHALTVARAGAGPSAMAGHWSARQWYCLHLLKYHAMESTRHWPDPTAPKSDGKPRPLGIVALEDKIAQRAVVAVLNAIYEEDFLGFSYGFRPKRSQHDALDALAVGITSTPVNWILDADIRGLFDSVSPGKADPFSGAPDRRQTHHPPSAKVAQGWRPGGRRMERQRDRYASRGSSITAARQCIPALSLRSLGRAMATA